MNGLLVQWGYRQASEEEVPITSYYGFQPYTSNYCVVVTKDSGYSSGNSDNDVRVFNKTLSSFYVYSSRCINFMWIAIGI